jgi:hypothetical protein
LLGWLTVRFLAFVFRFILPLTVQPIKRFANAELFVAALSFAVLAFGVPATRSLPYIVEIILGTRDTLLTLGRTRSEVLDVKAGELSFCEPFSIPTATTEVRRR